MNSTVEILGFAREAAWLPWAVQYFFLVGISVAGFFLFTEHRAHALAVLPFVLVALCPLMHLFGHGGHGHRDKEDKK